jgi:putative transposase
MDLNQAKKLKSMEDELRQYKQMYSELARENFILKDVIEKKL